MAEQLAEQKTLSDVLEQLKTANTLAATGELPFIIKEELGKTRSVSEDTTNAVKEGSEVVSGAVSKAGDATNKTAQALQKAQMGVWSGIKASLGFTGKTLSGMAKITGLQWALTKREGKASRLMEFGKAALKPITSALSSGISTLKDFLGTLAKLGMFLAAGGLLELFTNKKWQEFLGKMWSDMIKKVEEWWEASDFKKIFDEFKTKFLKWYANTAKPMIDKIIGWFEGDMKTNIEEMVTKFGEWQRTFNEFRTALLALSIAGLFGAVSPLRLIMSGLGSIFGPEGKIATKWKIIKEGATFQKWFGETSTLGKMFQSFKNFFGAEGKIATLWKTIREGANFQKLFGETSTLGKLFTAIKGFFGPESALGKAAIWVGELMLPVKNALMGGAKGTGVVSKLMGVFSWVFGAFGSVWKVLKAIVAPIMPFISGGLKIANAILTPFKAILWPITAIMGVGAAVVGFVQGFMGTEGGIADKIIGGFKGALQGLIDFFVVDIAVIMQDVLNWFLEKIPGASKVIDKFTFGDDLKKASDSFINNMVDNVADGFGVGKGGKINADSLAQSDFVKAGLAKVEDVAGVGTGDKLTLDPKKLTKYMEAMSVDKLKAFGSQLAKIEGTKGMKVENMAGIQKALMSKLTEKTEAAASARAQVDASVTNIKKEAGAVVAMTPAAASLDKQTLLEGIKIG